MKTTKSHPAEGFPETGIFASGKHSVEMKCFLAGTVGLLFVVFPMQAMETPINIENPGFEEPASANAERPEGWSVSFSNAKEGDGQATTGEVKRDETEAHTGKASAYLKTDGPRYARLRQPVKLLPGVKYRLTCWVRFNSPSTANQASIAVTGRLQNQEQWSRNTRSPTAGAGEWAQIMSEFETPVEARENAFIELRIVFSNAPINAWFDDVELVQIED